MKKLFTLIGLTLFICGSPIRADVPRDDSRFYFDALSNFAASAGSSHETNSVGISADLAVGYYFLPDWRAGLRYRSGFAFGGSYLLTTTFLAMNALDATLDWTVLRDDPWELSVGVSLGVGDFGGIGLFLGAIPIAGASYTLPIAGMQTLLTYYFTPNFGVTGQLSAQVVPSSSPQTFYMLHTGAGVTVRF